MRIAVALLLVVSVLVSVHAQGVVAPAALVQPGTDSWPMHNGDYSGRRFSPLTTVNSTNAGMLSLGWTHRVTAPGPAGGGGTTAAVIKGTPVVANGVLYVTIPDHVWAMDARTGRELWHASWPSCCTGSG